MLSLVLPAMVRASGALSAYSVCGGSEGISDATEIFVDARLPPHTRLLEGRYPDMVCSGAYPERNRSVFACRTFKPSAKKTLTTKGYEGFTLSPFSKRVK